MRLAIALAMMFAACSLAWASPCNNAAECQRAAREYCAQIHDRVVEDHGIVQHMGQSKCKIKCLGENTVYLACGPTGTSVEERIDDSAWAANRAQDFLLRNKGYVGSFGAEYWKTDDDKFLLLPIALPLVPFGACDSVKECHETGELVCGSGKVDKTKTKQKNMSTGNQCEGRCTNGKEWIVICSPKVVPLPM